MCVPSRFRFLNGYVRVPVYRTTKAACTSRAALVLYGRQRIKYVYLIRGNLYCSIQFCKSVIRVYTVRTIADINPNGSRSTGQDRMTRDKINAVVEVGSLSVITSVIIIFLRRFCCTCFIRFPCDSKTDCVSRI